MKPTGNPDGPEAKKAKVDPNETIMVKKVDDISHLKLYENTCINPNEIKYFSSHLLMSINIISDNQFLQSEGGSGGRLDK